MKVTTSIAWIGLLFLAAYGASADDPRNPGFDKCAARTKHAGVPKLNHMIYDRARKRIVAEGWRPRVTALTEEQIHALTWVTGGNADIFWSRGYKEVEACAPTGRGPCNFHFIDDFGNRLEIGTVGEERRKFGSRAVVDYVQMLCPKPDTGS